MSLGLTTLHDQNLSISFSDYDNSQVTEWLRNNILSQIQSDASITYKEGFEVVRDWLEGIAQGRRISLVSAGLGSDLLLFFELFKFANEGHKYFHALRDLPNSLNHTEHLDLNTLLMLAGYSPDSPRELWALHGTTGQRHDALYDAQLARDCFVQLALGGYLPKFRTMVLGAMHQ